MGVWWGWVTGWLSEIVLGTKGGQIEVNGIAPIFLTASNFERSREFYRKLLPFLGMKPVIDSDTSFYCVGGRTASGTTRRPPSMHDPRSSKNAPACIISAFAPASAPTVMN